MTEDIVQVGSQHVHDVLDINKNMIEKTLRMRCLAYLSQVKSLLLIETIHDMNKSRKELAHLSDHLEKQNKMLVIERDLLELKVEERRKIEKQAKEILDRSQKLESISTITSGISHDYNNMLGVITGYAELLEKALEKQPKLAGFAYQIRHASERGTRLTRKLLNFSKSKSSEAVTTNINNLIEDERQILEKSLTSMIQLELELANDLWPVLIDVDDFEDSIINLCINAMHAMEGNGHLTIRTSNATLSSIDAHILQLSIGDHVIVSITDSGCGMNESVKEKIFEPFYSTKGEKGTGLGLSQVYGFIARSDGAIKVYSEPNLGTSFSLYFPRNHHQKMVESVIVNEDYESYMGTETILIVDDDPAMLKLSCEILNIRGYNILSANCAKQALQILEQKSVALLLSDVVMPNMDGFQLAAIVNDLYPHIKIQLTSGFCAFQNKEMIEPNLIENIISKPFQSNVLLKRIFNLLNDID